MGIYLPNTEMPKSCADCDVACRFFLDRGLDGLLAKICRAESCLPDCPLVPVPPHGRLIDADALKPYMLNEHYKYRLVYDADEVANAPTIIPAEEG